MFTVITSLIDLIAEIIRGTFRLVGAFISSCFGLAIVALIGVVVVAVLLLI